MPTQQKRKIIEGSGLNSTIKYEKTISISISNAYKKMRECGTRCLSRRQDSKSRAIVSLFVVRVINRGAKVPTNTTKPKVKEVYKYKSTSSFFPKQHVSLDLGTQKNCHAPRSN